jgi:hypothetical protein
VVGKTEAQLDTLRICLVNFTDATLPTWIMRDGEGSDLIEFEVSEWIVQIETARRDRPFKEWRDGTHGHAPSHWLTIRRLDGSTFARADTTLLTDTLFLSLSFIQGSLVGFVLPTGLHAGSPAFVAWEATICSPWRPRMNWFDQTLAGSIGDVVRGWYERSRDDFWREVLKRACRMVLAANDSNPLDISVQTAFSALEVLGWATLRVEEDWIRKSDSRMTAASMLRLLLRWSAIDTRVPHNYDALRLFAKEITDVDAPSAVALVRNRIVHPPKGVTAEWPSFDVLEQAWRLSMEFAELVTLRLVGYQGDYGRRTQLTGRGLGDVHPVPWGRAHS